MVKTVELTGSEVEVSELGGQNVAVKNLGDGSIYASPYPNVAAGADNVVEIPAGGGEVVLDANGTVYLLGTGKVQCTGTPYATPNFKQPSSSASSGGGGEEKSEKGAYCGITEFVSSNAGVKTATVEYSADFPARLAEILAKETGWELQSDGVTVLKDGGVGFKFTSTYVWLANNLGAPTDYNFQYINGTASIGVSIDICTSHEGAVAFGCRGRNFDGTEQEMSFQFVLAQNADGEDVVMAEYQGACLYMLSKGKSSGDILTTGTLSNSPATKSAALALLPNDTAGCLLNGVFVLLSYPGGAMPSDSVFNIGGKSFRLLKCTVYSGTPLLAIPI